MNLASELGHRTELVEGLAMLPGSHELVTSLLILFGSAIIGGYLAWLLRLPLLLGYIVAGIVVGNLFTSFINTQVLNILADGGVTLLLFTLGIEFSFQRFRKVMSLVAWAVIIQIFATFLIIHVVLLAIGFTFFVSLIMAIAASFSSTAIVVKLLTEGAQHDTLYGEVAIAWLIIQDLAAVPIIVILPAVIGASSGMTYLPDTITILGTSLLKASTILVAILVFGRKLIPLILETVAKAKSRELFVVVTTAIVFLSAASMYALGLSSAIGAFLAGLLMAETSVNHAVFAEIRPLRDIFAVIFFVSLGVVVPIGSIISSFVILLGIALLILFVKCTLVYVLARFVGLHKKVAFLTALSLLPLSEFGFIVAREGVKLGVVNQENFTFLVMLTFVTIFIASPILTRGNRLYYRLNNLLFLKFPQLFPDNTHFIKKHDELPFVNHVVLCGYGRVGKYVGRALAMAKIPMIVVDYNHATILALKERGIVAVYGDPGDKDVLDYAQVDHARALIIAIPDKHTQELIIGNAQTLNRDIHIICRSHYEDDQKYLKALGVEVVVQPEFEAAISVVSRLLSHYGITADDINGKIARLKIEHGLG